MDELQLNTCFLMLISYSVIVKKNRTIKKCTIISHIIFYKYIRFQFQTKFKFKKILTKPIFIVII